MKSFREQADELINKYNLEFHDEFNVAKEKIKTLIEAGEYYIDYINKRVWIESEEAEEEAENERIMIKKSINKLKDSITAKNE